MENSTGTFILGVIAAIVLVLLWKKERDVSPAPAPAPGLPVETPIAAPGGCGCNGPGGCMGGPSDAISPAVQSSLAAIWGGQISPGTPPLNTVAGGQGATSFYSNDGTTADNSFTFLPVARNASPTAVGSPVQPGALQNNVPGSASTPAAVTPVRATQPVPPASELALQNRWTRSGVYQRSPQRFVAA